MSTPSDALLMPSAIRSSQTYKRFVLLSSIASKPTYYFPLSTKQIAPGLAVDASKPGCSGSDPTGDRIHCEGSIDIWLPTATGTFKRGQSIPIPEDSGSVCYDYCRFLGVTNIISGDFNGDGKADLIFAAQWEYVDYSGIWGWLAEEGYFLPGNGDGKFGEIGFYQYSPLEVPSQLITVNNNTVVRFNPAGRETGGGPELDIFKVSNGEIANTETTGLPYNYSPPLFVGRFNGSLSFLFSSSGGTGTSGATDLTVIDTNGSVIASTTVPGIFNPTSVNRFGSHADLAGTYTDPNGNTGVAIFFGNGDGTFNPTPLFIPDPPGYASQSLYVADFNGDNKPDIVAALNSSTKPGELEVLLNSSNPKTPKVSVVSSSNPSTEGGTVTFTATVKPKPLNWATEFVTFYSGTTKLAKVQLVNGTASVSTAKLGPGTHTITAAYSGDCCDYLPASVSMSEVVEK